MRSRLRVAWARATGVFTRSRRDRELQEEMASHLEMQLEENLSAGMDPEQARREARLKLGSVTQARELYHERQGLPLLDALLQDVRVGLRMMRRTPGFTAVALATLTLGIGANAVMFSLVNAVLLRPLPYPEAERLLHVQTVDAKRQEAATAVPDFHEYRARNRSFEGLSAWYLRSLDLTGGAAPERIRALAVSSDFLSVLRTPPALGRDLLPRDERWGEHRVAILTDGFWRTRFAADPAVLGLAVTLDSEPFTVVGVLPPHFSFQAVDVQALVPMSFAPGDNLNSHNNYFLTMVGRLRPGVTTATALDDLNALSRAIALAFPENEGTQIGMKPLQEALVGDVRPALLVLLGAVAFVLLIACANLANLVLARGAGRQRELALRLALGATRGRVLRQLLTESVLLAVGGSVLAIGLAWAAVRALEGFDQDILPRGGPIQVDGTVLLFTALVAIATAILFGLAPALRTLDLDARGALKDGARTAGDPRGRGLRAVLVVSEVALSLMLLIGAGLMAKSLRGLTRLDAGFDPSRVLTAQLSLPRLRYIDVQAERRFSRLAYARANRFFDDVLRETRGLPGVEAAGAISGLPLMGEVWGKSLTLFDRPLPATYAQLPTIQYRVVAGHYFRALRVPIVTGRAFTETDTEPAAKVAIVNQALARLHWPDQDPLGKEIAVNPPAHLLTPGSVPPDYEPSRLTVVGVAGDVRYGALSAAPRPLVYAPYAQGAEGTTTMFLVVRAAENAGDLMPAIRDRIRRVDPDIPASSVRTMEARAAAARAAPQRQTRILGAFAGLALLLSATGVYGVTSYTARQRTREVGIRMAVGAGSRSILALFLRQGVTLVGIGILAGLAGAGLLTRSLQALLYQVSATDPWVFAAITALLLAVALAAAWLPARRATRLDPVVALREE